MSETPASSTPLIKPINPAGMVSNLMSRLYGMDVIHWKELISYDDRNFRVIVHKEHKNPHLDDVDPNGYLLKVFNLRDSQISQYIDALYTMTDFIRQKKVPTPERIPNLDGKFFSLQKIYTDLENPSCTEYREYMVVLQTFIPGSTLDKVPLTPRLFYRCGKFTGFIDKALKGFYHSYYENHQSLWSMESIPKLKDFTFVIEDQKKHQVTNEVIDAYKWEILPLFPEFQKGQIHGDMNLLNILAQEKPSSTASNPLTTGNSSINITEDKDYVLCGIIDFADATYSFSVFDLAMMITYLMIDCKLDNPLEVGGHVLAGYLREFDLKQVEKEALPLLVCGRLVQSLVLGHYTYWQNPTNLYPLDTAKNGWPLLFKLWKYSMKELYDFWAQVTDSYMCEREKEL